MCSINSKQLSRWQRDTLDSDITFETCTLFSHRPTMIRSSSFSVPSGMGSFSTVLNNNRQSDRNHAASTRHFPSRALRWLQFISGALQEEMHGRSLEVCTRDVFVCGRTAPVWECV